MLVNNRKLIIRKIAEDLNMAYGSVHDILVYDMGFRRVAAKFHAKKKRFDVATEIYEAESDPTFIKRIITVPVTSFCSIELKNHYGERVSAAERK